MSGNWLKDTYGNSLDERDASNLEGLIRDSSDQNPFSRASPRHPKLK